MVHLHIQEVPGLGKVGEVPDHKLVGALEERGRAEGLRQGGQGQTVTDVQGSDQVVAAGSGQDGHLGTQTGQTSSNGVFQLFNSV